VEVALQGKGSPTGRTRGKDSRSGKLERLSDIKAWNEATSAELKGRIEHYDISCPR
jgi:hypothetical protein